MELEEGSELHGISAAHDLAQAENGCEIADEACDDDGGRGERSNARLVCDKMRWQMPFPRDNRQEGVSERGH